MNKDCTFFSDLKCRECGRLYKKEAIHICEYDFGPLEASYDYDLIRQSISREIFAGAPQQHVALSGTVADRRQRPPWAQRSDSLRWSRPIVWRRH